MAPLTGAAEAAVQGFFRGRRGTRVLRTESADALSFYNVARGTTLAELPTTRPADTALVVSWVETGKVGGRREKG